MQLSTKTIKIIKQSAHLVTANAEEITSQVYVTLFTKYPDIKKLFVNAPNDQFSILAEAISAYAVNIDKLYKLEPALDIIARTHVKENIKPLHYPIVGMVFIQALGDVLKENATIEFLDAWKEAYKYLSYVLINMEDKLSSRELI